MKQLQKILLVDNDLINNYLNKRLLEKMKLAEEVMVEHDPEEAIKNLIETYCQTKISPELILVDINMPGINGFDFIKIYNSLEFLNKQDVTIVTLSTSSHYKDKERMLYLGINHFITKPLTEVKVKEFLGSLILRKAVIDQRIQLQGRKV